MCILLSSSRSVFASLKCSYGSTSVRNQFLLGSHTLNPNLGWMLHSSEWRETGARADKEAHERCPREGWPRAPDMRRSRPCTVRVLAFGMGMYGQGICREGEAEQVAMTTYLLDRRVKCVLELFNELLDHRLLGAHAVPSALCPCLVPAGALLQGHAQYSTFTPSHPCEPKRGHPPATNSLKRIDKGTPAGKDVGGALARVADSRLQLVCNL